jgi:hypothetical protein
MRLRRASGVVHVRRTQRHEDELPRVENEPRVREPFCERQEPVQRVDHDVADEVDPCRVDAFVPQVDVGVARRSGEERREPCRSRS